MILSDTLDKLIDSFMFHVPHFLLHFSSRWHSEANADPNTSEFLQEASLTTVVRHVPHHKVVLAETSIEHFEFASNKENLPTTLAVLTHLAAVVMSDADHKKVFRQLRLYIKTASSPRITKLLAALGDSFIADISKEADKAGYLSRYLQLYFDTDDRGVCTSHKDDANKMLFKMGGGLEITKGMNHGGKTPLYTINCEKGMSLINGLNTGALTGRDPISNEPLNLYHQNFSRADLPNATFVLVDGSDKPGDIMVLVAGIKKAAVKWYNGEWFARVIAAVEKVGSADALISNVAVKKAMIPLDTDFDSTGRPTRPPTEEEDRC
jgi:hypothetical protein